ncbi:MAG: glycosyl transferase family 1, partial [Hymenobacter sp.]
MKIIMSHPTGNANVRAVANGLLQANMLATFHTTVATFPGNILERLSAVGPFGELKRRHFDAALQAKTRMWPWREIGRTVALKAGFTRLVTHETGLFCVDAVYRSLDEHVATTLPPAAAQKAVDAVYAYEDGAAISFHQAKQLGLKCYYDLPIGYWRAAQRLLEPERNRWPAWEATIPSFENSVAKLARKDEELRMADRIFVASQFTADTLKDFPGQLAPISVIPYGFPKVGEDRSYPAKNNNRPLKLLFV